MKITGMCTKCGSSDVIRIPGQRGAYGSGNNIPTGMTIFSSVKVTRYLCGQCGFSEEWVEDDRGIGKIRRKYSP